MRIGTIGQDPRQIGSGAREPARDGSEGRALVLLAPKSEPHAGTAGYRQAPFLAHLLAIKDQHPQTRERRRATPQEAIAAYRAAAALTARS
jgi:hypothetical protein